jgi:hypothetical protein
MPYIICLGTCCILESRAVMSDLPPRLSMLFSSQCAYLMRSKNMGPNRELLRVISDNGSPFTTQPVQRTRPKVRPSSSLPFCLGHVEQTRPWNLFTVDIDYPSQKESRIQTFRILFLPLGQETYCHEFSHQTK